MKKHNCLSAREEELLHILWELNEPLTAGEMAERLSAGGWNRATVRSEERRVGKECGS